MLISVINDIALMKKLLTPDGIYKGVLKGEINKTLAVEQLISLIEGSNIPQLRSKAIDTVKLLNFKELNTFKVIENALLSDESALVRNSAADLICVDYLDEGLQSLIWVLEHEKSPLILNTIFKYVKELKGSNEERLRRKFNTIFQEIANKVGISESESPFILELDTIFAEGGEPYAIDFKGYTYFQLLRNMEGSQPWLLIQNNHIISLTLNYFNWNYIKCNLDQIESILKIDHLALFLSTLKSFNAIREVTFKIPESIGYLTFLKTLDLSSNNIVEIPEEIGTLKHLETLILRDNNLSEIPEAIFTLPLLKVLDLRDNNELDSERTHFNSTDSLTILKS
ncbi:MAG: leucine-rich repeat domain-containing protein [Candidatus Hermodarchaeota archaeon]